MRQAYLLSIRPGMEESYRKAHETVWPELIREAASAGIRNHSVFLNGRTLFVYLEADDPGEALRWLGRSEVKKRWDRFMEEFLEPGSVPLEEVFYME